ncbi:ABC transporter permease [Priestia megaterium]|uniref:ABC transporter permease n=1 Tax=Priestia megaterium TaxID=1404 RepID=UPI001C22B333|nr:ABC transporter permease subunit [Priestia megaterium]MBU8689928.1 ABC transporter permease [Priestia megaterium]
MWAINIKEFQSLFKSIKSIIVILIVCGASYGIAHIVSQLGGQLTSAQIRDGANGGILVMLLGFGPLFISSLSHNVINQEIKTRTARFLVTKTSRERIVLGKFLGICCFWLVCISISFLLIAFISHHFSLYIFLECLLFTVCIISFVLMLSALMPNPTHTMFLSIILSFVLPVLSGWSIFSSKAYIAWFKYVTPYYYLKLEKGYLTVLLIFTALCLCTALWSFKRREV